MKTELRRHLLRLFILSLTCAIGISSGPLPAQPPGGRQRSGPDAKAADPTETPSEKKKSPVTAITGGDILTVTKERIRRGTILIQDGKILNVGQDVAIPDGATVIDAAGRTIVPGFVSISTSGTGLSGGGGSNNKIADQLNPFDDNLKLSLGVGITSACVQVSSGRSGFRRRRSEDELFPGLDPVLTDLVESADDFNPDFGDPNTSVCPCCGLPILPTEPIEETPPQPIQPQDNFVIKMSAGELKGMLVSETVFFHVTPGALSGALNRHQWRQTIASAREYLKQQAEHEQKTAAGDRQRPPRKPVGDEVLNLVQKKVALRIQVDSVDAMRDMIDLARELDYRLVIDGATEGWVIPDELAEAGVSVVITPRQRRRSDFAKEDSTGSNIEMSRILEQAGVPFAVSPLSSSISLNGLAGRDLTSLPLEAAFAVRGGCSEQTALAALTIVPARMLGLEDRIGSIETGKDADLLILNGSPLDYRTWVETAIVNGRVAYERGSDRVYPVYER